MRFFVFPPEGLDEDMRAALTRGLGLVTQNVAACERHCQRYGIADVDTFVDELEEAQASLATAHALGASVMVDPHGRLCYDVPSAPEDRWRDDRWLATLLGETEA